MEERYYRRDAQVSGAPDVPGTLLIPRMLKLTVGLALALVLPGTALAATALPTVQRTLSASNSSGACTAGATDSTTYTAPMAGFLTTRLNAASGDWDLAVTDAASHRSLSTSRAFGSHEVAQAWVNTGQQLRITGCRLAGNASTAAVSVQLVDAQREAAETASIVRFKGLTQGQLQMLDKLGFDASESQHETYSNVLVPSAAKLGLLKRMACRSRRSCRTTTPRSSRRGRPTRRRPSPVRRRCRPGAR